jgi:hypothetical protein
MSPGVTSVASERYYKVSAEALRVCERLVPVLRGEEGGPVDPAMVPVAQVRGGGHTAGWLLGVFMAKAGLDTLLAADFWLLSQRERPADDNRLGKLCWSGHGV